MPLRDHFRPPLSDRRSWQGFHGQWPATIVAALNQDLPRRYIAEPQVRLGSSIEVDVATYDEDLVGPRAAGNGGGVAVAAWVPPRPTMAIATERPEQDEYEVRVYDTAQARRLVAAVELVSPANKDRPEHRRSFVAKCSALLQAGVCVVIVDVVTTRAANLYGELRDFIGQADPSPAGATPLSAAACRWADAGERWLLETWAYPLELGQTLPTLPLWLAGDLAVPLDLEASYEETCRALRIP